MCVQGAFLSSCLAGLLEKVVQWPTLIGVHSALLCTVCQVCWEKSCQLL